MSPLIRLILVILLIVIPTIGGTSIWAYMQERERLEEAAIDKIEAIAEIQSNRLKQATSRYIEGAQLVASRTQMRKSLRDFNEGGSETARASVTKIITDADASSREINFIAIYDTEGELVAVSDQETSIPEYLPHDEKSGLAYVQDVYLDNTGAQNVRVSAKLVLDGEVLGTASVVQSVDAFFAVTNDYTGLGETGEIIITKESDFGSILYVLPLRFDANAALSRIVSTARSDDIVVKAQENIGRTFDFKEKRTVDYRGENVVAVSRFIESLNWNLIVKVDAAEAKETVRGLQFSLLMVLLATVLASALLILIIGGAINTRLRSYVKALRLLQEGNLNVEIPKGVFFELSELGEIFEAVVEEKRSQIEKEDDRVARRTEAVEKKKGAVEDQLSEVQRLNSLMIDREAKMIELKKEIETLKQENEKNT